MKLSEIRPCDRCNGPLMTGGYAVDVSLLVVNPRAAQQAVGLSMLLGSVGLADTMGSPDVVVVAGDKEPSLRTRLLICQTCALNEPLDLAVLLEKENARARG